MTKFVYSFGGGKAEGSSLMRNLLGGKGCELAEMTNLGIPVPPGFTITTEAWVAYNRDGQRQPDGLWEEVLQSLGKLESMTQVRASVTPTVPCSSPSVPGRVSPCRA